MNTFDQDSKGVPLAFACACESDIKNCVYSLPLRHIFWFIKYFYCQYFRMSGQLESVLES